MLFGLFISPQVHVSDHRHFNMGMDTYFDTSFFDLNHGENSDSSRVGHLDNPCPTLASTRVQVT